MLILKNSSNISGFDLDFIHEVEINSSWNNLTDSARVVIPKKITYKKNGVFIDEIVRGENPIYNIGDSAVLNAGYAGGIGNTILTERFRGFISDVSPKLPIEMMLSDEMYLLKQQKVGSYSKKDLTLTQLLSDIMPSDIPFTSDDRNIGYIRIKDPNTTVAGVLKHLKDKQGIISYFRDGTLISGFSYITENPSQVFDEIVFDARVNIVDDSNLIYNKEEEYKINLTVVSIYPDNSKEQVRVGDESGDKRTIYVYDIPKTELEDIANEELKKFKYEGFRGSFVTFLDPIVKHGDAVTILDNRVSDRNGTYLVKSVTTNYGMGGGRQTIELDRRVS